LLLPPRVRVRVRRGWRGREGHQGETARENWSGTEKREEKGDEIEVRELEEQRGQGKWTGVGEGGKWKLL
jgi:hypothetical protein